MESTCPKCGGCIVFGSNICQHCRINLSYCKQCKNPNEIDFRICKHCGIEPTSVALKKNVKNFLSNELTLIEKPTLINWIIIGIMSLVVSFFFSMYVEELAHTYRELARNFSSIIDLSRTYRDSDSMFWFWVIFIMGFSVMLRFSIPKTVKQLILFSGLLIVADLVITFFIVGGAYTFVSKIWHAYLIVFLLLLLNNKKTTLLRIIITMTICIELIQSPIIVLDLILGDADWSATIIKDLVLISMLSTMFFVLYKNIFQKIKFYKNFEFSSPVEKLSNILTVMVKSPKQD